MLFCGEALEIKRKTIIFFVASNRIVMSWNYNAILQLLGLPAFSGCLSSCRKFLMVQLIIIISAKNHCRLFERTWNCKGHQATPEKHFAVQQSKCFHWNAFNFCFHPEVVFIKLFIFSIFKPLWIALHLLYFATTIGEWTYYDILHNTCNIK